MCLHIHYSLLIEKDIWDHRNISVKLPYVCVCLSSEDLFIFFSKSFLILYLLLFYPYYGTFLSTWSIHLLLIDENFSEYACALLRVFVPFIQKPRNFFGESSPFIATFKLISNFKLAENVVRKVWTMHTDLERDLLEFDRLYPVTANLIISRHTDPFTSLLQIQICC